MNHRYIVRAPHGNGYYYIVHTQYQRIQKSSFMMTISYISMKKIIKRKQKLSQFTKHVKHHCSMRIKLSVNTCTFVDINVRIFCIIMEKSIDNFNSILESTKKENSYLLDFQCKQFVYCSYYDITQQYTGFNPIINEFLLNRFF